jgi:hypothetical protein
MESAFKKRRYLVYAAASFALAAAVAIVLAARSSAQHSHARPLLGAVAAISSRGDRGGPTPGRGPTFGTPADFALDVPTGIDPSTYRELGTVPDNRGQVVRLFRGQLERNARACFGVRTAEFISTACGADSTTPLQVLETTFRGHRMLSGLLTSDVKTLLLSTTSGTVRVPIRGNGTFFFDRAWGNALRAYDAAGQLIATYLPEA